MPAERLQKIIAAAGIASRRKAEQIITGGLVSVNGPGRPPNWAAKLIPKSITSASTANFSMAPSDMFIC